MSPRPLMFAVLALAAALAGVAPAHASKGVPATIVGCVFGGLFTSSDGYEIHPRSADGRAFDLRPFEGHTVTLNGTLLPGDVLIIKKPPTDSGTCTMMRPEKKSRARRPVA